MPASHSNGPKRLTARCCSRTVTIAQVIVERDAGVVDEHVERIDLIDSPLDLRSAGHIQRQR